MLRTLGDGEITATLHSPQDGTTLVIPLDLWHSKDGPDAIVNGSVTFRLKPGNPSVVLQEWVSGDVLIPETRFKEIFGFLGTITPPSTQTLLQPSYVNPPSSISGYQVERSQGRPAPTHTPPISETTATRSAGGRPPKWDWDAFWVQIVHVANGKDGLPESRAELHDQMINWFHSKYNGCPVDSEVRKRIAMIYPLKT